MDARCNNSKDEALIHSKVGNEKGRKSKKEGEKKTKTKRIRTKYTSSIKKLI